MFYILNTSETETTEENEMNKAILTRNYFGHKSGESVDVLKFIGSGMYSVRFENGETANIGRSIMQEVPV